MRAYVLCMERSRNLSVEEQIKACLEINNNKFSAIVKSIKKSTSSEVNSEIKHMKYDYRRHSVFFYVSDGSFEKIMIYDPETDKITLHEKATNLSKDYTDLVEEIEN